MNLIFVQISKKLVNSDYKNHRVEDPTYITIRKEKQVKQHVKEYFDKAAAKRREHEKKKAERKGKDGGMSAPQKEITELDFKKEDESDQEPEVNMSDDEVEKEKQNSDTPITPMDQITNGDGLKRKRDDMGDDGTGIKPEEEDATPSKRLRSETPPPPPPPPPPPSDSIIPNETLLPDVRMVETVEGTEYSNSYDVRYDASPHDLMDEREPLRDSPMLEVDPTAPSMAFALVGPLSGHMENSDQTQSPSVFEASDVTPMESEGERVDQPDESYAAMGFERVQRLQVHHGS